MRTFSMTGLDEAKTYFSTPSSASPAFRLLQSVWQSRPSCLYQLLAGKKHFAEADWADLLCGEFQILHKHPENAAGAKQRWKEALENLSGYPADNTLQHWKQRLFNPDGSLIAGQAHPHDLPSPAVILVLPQDSGVHFTRAHIPRSSEEIELFSYAGLSQSSVRHDLDRTIESIRRSVEHAESSTAFPSLHLPLVELFDLALDGESAGIALWAMWFLYRHGLSAAVDIPENGTRREATIPRIALTGVVREGRIDKVDHCDLKVRAALAAGYEFVLIPAANWSEEEELRSYPNVLPLHHIDDLERILCLQMLPGARELRLFLEGHTHRGRCRGILPEPSPDASSDQCRWRRFFGREVDASIRQLRLKHDLTVWRQMLLEGAKPSRSRFQCLLRELRQALIRFIDHCRPYGELFAVASQLLPEPIWLALIPIWLHHSRSTRNTAQRNDSVDTAASLAAREITVTWQTRLLHRDQHLQTALRLLKFGVPDILAESTGSHFASNPQQADEQKVFLWRDRTFTVEFPSLFWFLCSDPVQASAMILAGYDLGNRKSDIVQALIDALDPEVSGVSPEEYAADGYRYSEAVRKMMRSVINIICPGFAPHSSPTIPYQERLAWLWKALILTGSAASPIDAGKRIRMEELLQEHFRQHLLVRAQEKEDVPRLLDYPAIAQLFNWNSASPEERRQYSEDLSGLANERPIIALLARAVKSELAHSQDEPVKKGQQKSSPAPIGLSKTLLTFLQMSREDFFSEMRRFLRQYVCSGVSEPCSEISRNLSFACNPARTWVEQLATSRLESSDWLKELQEWYSAGGEKLKNLYQLLAFWSVSSLLETVADAGTTEKFGKGLPSDLILPVMTAFLLHAKAIPEHWMQKLDQPALWKNESNLQWLLLLRPIAKHSSSASEAIREKLRFGISKAAQEIWDAYKKIMIKKGDHLAQSLGQLLMISLAGYSSLIPAEAIDVVRREQNIFLKRLRFSPEKIRKSRIPFAALWAALNAHKFRAKRLPVSRILRHFRHQPEFSYGMLVFLATLRPFARLRRSLHTTRYPLGNPGLWANHWEREIIETMLIVDSRRRRQRSDIWLMMSSPTTLATII